MKHFFIPSDKSMFWTMLRSEVLQDVLNFTPLWNIPLRNALLRRIVGGLDGPPYCFLSPIHFQEGNNTYIGRNLYASYNLIVIDHSEVRIGDNVFIAPNVTITTVGHPMIGEERRVKHFKNSFEPHKRGGIEVVAPVSIGNDVWIGAGTVICSGVSIGEGSVIGAGSIVTRSIPENTFACGAPCRVVREISEEESIEGLIPSVRMFERVEREV